MVREAPVQLEVERHDLEGQLGEAGRDAEHGGHGHAAHAVARVDDHLERPDAGQVDEAAQVAGVVGQGVVVADRARLGDGLHALGLRVPADLSVVGIDDSPEAKFMVPPLSTVELDFRFEGEHVVTSLISLIEGRATDQSLRLPAPRLVRRASTGAVGG